MIKAAYIDKKTGFLYFQEDNIVFRTINSFKHFLNQKGPIRYEWEIWNLSPTGQPYAIVDEQTAYDLATKLHHPDDCVMDINATIESLKFKILDDGIVSKLRVRKKISHDPSTQPHHSRTM